LRLLAVEARKTRRGKNFYEPLDELDFRWENSNIGSSAMLSDRKLTCWQRQFKSLLHRLQFQRHLPPRFAPHLRYIEFRDDLDGGKRKCVTT
jgi:hypothetical protein